MISTEWEKQLTENELDLLNTSGEWSIEIVPGIFCTMYHVHIADHSIQVYGSAKSKNIHRAVRKALDDYENSFHGLYWR